MSFEHRPWLSARSETRRESEAQAGFPGSLPAASQRRSIARIISGEPFGQTVRMCAPVDAAAAIAPFVCVESEQLDPHQPDGRPRPFSGCAVITVVCSGAAWFQDTAGRKSRLAAGGVSALLSGSGAWQAAAPLSRDITRIFRVGIALAPAAENLPAQTVQAAPSAVPQAGPARVILGRLGDVPGAFDAPADVNLLDVQLLPRQSWQYSPPAEHPVCWIAVERGRLLVHGGTGHSAIQRSELAVFDGARGMIDVQADRPTSFMIGTARAHPHPIVSDRFSVHTSKQAMGVAKAAIARLGRELLARGRLP